LSTFLTKIARSLLLGLLFSTPLVSLNSARSQEEVKSIPVALAEWQKTEQGEAIGIVLRDLLNKKQINMINGGFTTVSQIRIVSIPYFDGITIESLDREFEDEIEVDRVLCSVKFDAWEETYDVANIYPRGAAKVLKTFDEFAQSCLVSTISDEKILESLNRGGILVAEIQVKQTSYTEAKEIKEWMIKQQSGVMAGLFSHMLGNVQLAQSKVISVSIPQRPVTQEGGTNAKSPRTGSKG
jgi:hypothetical protein